MPKELNPLLHSQLRLGVMSILMVKEEADFVYLKEKTESTAGNLSVQKGFEGKRPRTTCRITPEGKAAFEEYVDTLKVYLHLE